MGRYQGRVKLGSNWWPLLERADGTPVYEQTPIEFFPPRVSQEDVTEANFPPEARLPYTFRNLSDGGGISETPARGGNTGFDRIGDAEGEGVDTTLTPIGPVVLAATLNQATLTPTPTGDFLGGLRVSTTALAFAMGRYVYSFNGTAFSNSGDLGVGLSPTDAIFSYRGAQTQDYWYAPLGYSTTPKYSTDSGATWTSVGGSDFVNVGCAVVIDGEVVFARASDTGQGSAMIATLNDGGSAPSYFGKIDPVGDPAMSISRLIAFAGRVVVVKDREGLFLLAADRASLQQELFPELRGVTIFYNAIRVWRGVLWLPTERGLYVVTAGFTLQQVGPEVVETAITMGNRGVIHGLDGDAYNLYGVRYAGTSGTSTLYKAVVAVAGGAVQRIAWHPFLQLATGADAASVQTMVVNSLPRIVFGRKTSGPTYGLYWFILPGAGRDPRQDSAYRYCSGGTLYYPRLTARFPTTTKSFLSLSTLCAPLQTAVDGQTATTAQGIRNRYKLDSTPLTAVSPFGYTQGSAQTTGTGTRDDLTAIRGRGLDLGVRLSSSDSTTSPQLNATTVGHDLEPDVLWQHRFSLLIGTASTDPKGGRAGWKTPMTPGAALRALRALPASGPLAFVDPWDNGYDVTIPIGGIAARPAGGPELGSTGELPLLVNVVANEQLARILGTYAALAGSKTYGDLTVYQYGQLSSLS